MDKKTLVILVVLMLAIAGGVTRSVLANREDRPLADTKPFEQLGRHLADEAQRLLGGSGKVVVMVETMNGARAANFEPQLKGFRAGLAQMKGVTLAEVKDLSRNLTDDPGFWPESFATQIAAAKGDVVVLFVNFPNNLKPAEFTALKACSAKLLAVTARSPSVELLINDRLIRTAVVGRNPVQPAPKGKESSSQWFDRTYLVLKAP